MSPLLGSSLLGLLLSPALAHTGAPAALTVREGALPEQWELSWTHPLTQAGPGELRTTCTSSGWGAPSLEPDRVVWSQSLRCPAAGPPVLELWESSDAPAAAQAPLLVRFLPHAGPPTHRLLTLSTTPVEVRADEGVAAGLWTYFKEGARHVLGGIDHLLILLGLSLAATRQAQPRRATLQTVAAFGVGHAITVVLLGVGWLRPPVSWCEAAIALTLVALGLQSWRAQLPTSWRWAAGCGLIHGLGLGSGLAELGLPLGQRALALLSFNLGVDLVQVVAAILSVTLILRLRRHPQRLDTILAVCSATIGFALLWTAALS